MKELPGESPRPVLIAACVWWWCASVAGVHCVGGGRQVKGVCHEIPETQQSAARQRVR